MELIKINKVLKLQSEGMIKQSVLLKVLALYIIIYGNLSCSGTDVKDPVIVNPPKSEAVANLKVEKSNLDKAFYKAGEQVSLTLSLANPRTDTVLLENLVVLIRKITGTSIAEKSIPLNALLKSGEKLDISATPIWNIPSDASPTVYQVFLQYKSGTYTSTPIYETFFHIITSTSILDVYAISKENYRGLNVFKLNGGMSAELAVEKSAEALTAGISHSWNVSAKGSGPNAIVSSPDFLNKSVQQTIDFYDNILGVNSSLETVIIGTGVPSVGYLAATMKAPVLPLHFLVGTNSIREIQTIVNHSIQQGFSAYATIGHDPSVVSGVAWIKLLSMPEAYQQFIQRHQVKNVILVGYSGSTGETIARKVVDTRAKYDPGSIYIMFPQGGTSADLNSLQSKLVDLNTSPLSSYTIIADWESGIISQQVESFSTSLKQLSGISEIAYLTSTSDIALWDLGAYVTLAFLNKNRNVQNNPKPVGITLNPYLIEHPLYELRMGYVPLLYWQANSAVSTIDRINTVVKSALTKYYPEIDYKNLFYWVNSTNNFGGQNQAFEMQAALDAQGFNNVKLNDFSTDEIWNTTDGMNAPCEVRAEELLTLSTSAELQNWYSSQNPLTIADLKELSSSFKAFSVVSK